MKIQSETSMIESQEEPEEHTQGLKSATQREVRKEGGERKQVLCKRS